MFIGKERLMKISVIFALVLMFCIPCSAMCETEPNLSFLTEEQLEAYYYLKALPPGWINKLSEEFGIDKSYLMPLYNSGMSYMEVRNYLLELYPYEKIKISNQNLIELADETGISNIDAIKCYELAYKWRKDPVWLADLFKRTGSWDAIESAFRKWKEADNTLYEVSKISNGVISNSEASFQISRIYNANSQSVQSLINYGAKQDDINNILFFLDIEESAKNFERSSKEDNVLVSSSISQNTILDLKTNEQLQEGWIDELPEEINYLKQTWPIRQFPQELLPLKVPNSKKNAELNSEQLIKMPQFELKFNEGLENESITTR